jgi:hypothetical protein
MYETSILTIRTMYYLKNYFVIYSLNYYVISIYKFYVISIFKLYALFEMLNSIKLICCAHFILHTTKFKIVKI